MKLTLLLAFALQGQPSDRWFSADKIKHFFMGAFVQSVTYSGLRATGVGHRSSLLGATAGNVVISVGKEVADSRRTGLFSRRDLVWDAAGAGASTLLLIRTDR